MEREEPELRGSKEGECVRNKERGNKEEQGQKNTPGDEHNGTTFWRAAEAIFIETFTNKPETREGRVVMKNAEMDRDF